MSQNLTDWVDEQLRETDLADEAVLLVLAALEGDETLDAYVNDGQSVKRPEPSAADARGEASGVVLTSITVEGFRGIGQESELKIAPKPGLTVVAGRNGSGKSSFSEALELVLTGGTYRWANKSAEWRDQWRNLHHPSAKVSIGLVEEGVGPIAVSATWAANEKSVESRTVKAQVAGKPQVDGIDHLGWRKALEQFRPILSYDELGGMLEGKQSGLYDALASILGVEQLGDAVKRLKARSDARKGPGTTAGAKRRELQDRAAQSTDERAVEAAKLLRKTDPDTAALRTIATGGHQVDRGPLPALRVLAMLSAPEKLATAAAVQRLRDAKNGLADAGAKVSQRNHDRLKLMEQGLLLHATHGDQTCPVCRVGNLDGGWAEASRELAEHSRRQFEDVELAHQTFDHAFDALRRLLQPPPAVLRAAPIGSITAPVQEAHNAWNAWSSVPVSRDADGADALATHVESALPALTAAVTALADAAMAEVSALDDQWQPLASAIAGWCEEWESWKQTEPIVKHLQAAEKWLKENDLRLKNERLAPIANQAREAWQRLRQESNVELGGLQLTGTNTSRRLRVSGAIDGEPVDSFAVFSQGELHALTLALFLPRATLADSPFRFVVLDDPVQAMDPAKVDGLVDLLGELGRTRQVIVFSHDDRLPAALRRSSYDATILEVNRGANSQVTVTTSQDPTIRYLADAHGLIKEWENGNLSEDDLRRTLPGLYRFAIESAAKDRYFATQLRQGVSIHDLEKVWTETHATKRRVNLAVFGTQPAEHLAQAWSSPEHRKAALGMAASGFHKGLSGWVDPDDAHYKAKRLVDDIRNGAK
ncbi:AAA family ATPase [Tessaracoccus antarcticus]|uniref:Nuclease SbcCD subunit C n=1 Tax=Tessaracoccus antarcticus TaxID=2479848 RepID=A0A3M0G4S6_9ACTN|nr:AAA family ATPase [Tessaracoccus antarcticus]RMB57232.1 recombinase RecF [Tessaracoccus antarcticus]